MVFVFLLCLSGECAIICYLRQPLGVRRGYPFFFGLVMIEKPRRGLCLGLCWITSLILDEDMYCWHIRYWLDGETIKVSLWQYLADARSIRKIRKRIQRYLLDPAGNLPCSYGILLPYHAYNYVYTYTHVCIYNYIYRYYILYIYMYIYIHYIYKQMGQEYVCVFSWHVDGSKGGSHCPMLGWGWTTCEACRKYGDGGVSAESGFSATKNASENWYFNTSQRRWESKGA